jgi:formate dehydrogenase subunit delta
MDVHKLEHMANQIAAFFAAYPHDEAVAGVASHIRTFWEPRMRRQLADMVAEGGVGLSPLVVEAARTLDG